MLHSLFIDFFVALKPLEGPTFTSPLSNVMARAGQKIRLECCIAGSPPPSLVWTHDGKPLKETRDLKVCLVFISYLP